MPFDQLLRILHALLLKFLSIKRAHSMPSIVHYDSGTLETPPRYFKSLAELDDWAVKPQIRGVSDGVLNYKSRSTLQGPGESNKGKLLVCHDYKGGYTESPSALAYTFNFWDRCDTFIYFSHNRVTIPPPGWINAAHRQGVKILGVLIFEHQESVEDCLRLLVGKLPASRTGPAVPSQNNGLPVSPHYARLLSDLAQERGFDGYLLNFEYPFQGRSEQARALEAWVSLLRSELKNKVGGHAQTIWYDSIITTGDLRWQDRLNSRNLPFFLASDSFFTNYTWPNIYPSICAQYLLSLDASLMQANPKSLNNIFVGVDVWGRGSHGGGGFGSYKAIEHADPEFMGLSLAMFGPAWTWESEQDKEGWDWNRWWAYERKLWLGPEIEGEKVEVPDAPQRQGEPPCAHGDFRPVGNFFQSLPPPDPKGLPFFTSFCPGVGYSWFVEGRTVLHKDSGWTDIDKQTSLGDQLWPRPQVSWEGSPLAEPLPKASTSLDFSDAFNGGSSLVIKLSGTGVSSDDALFQCFWIPFQSFTLSWGILYEAQMIYKASWSNTEIDLALSVKPDQPEYGIDVKPVVDATADEFANGWSKITVRFRLAESPDNNARVKLGIILGTALEDPSLLFEAGIRLGQISVYPAPPPAVAPYKPRLLWADCARGSDPTESLVVTWESSVAFTAPASVTDLSPENPHPPWILDRSPQWFPCFLCFNIYARPQTPSNGDDPSDGLQFLGTSGLDGMRNRFSVRRGDLPPEIMKGPIRILVQGVTDRGVVMPWKECVFVDVE